MRFVGEYHARMNLLRAIASGSPNGDVPCRSCLRDDLLPSDFAAAPIGKGRLHEGQWLDSWCKVCRCLKAADRYVAHKKAGKPWARGSHYRGRRTNALLETTKKRGYLPAAEILEFGRARRTPRRASA